MKIIDLVIWLLVGLTLFLIWSRFVAQSCFAPEDEKWIAKARQMAGEGKSEIEIRSMLLIEAGYRDGHIIDEIYRMVRGSSPSS